MKVLEEFDISKYITATDIVSAVTAGTIAYLTYKTKQDEPAPKQPHGQAGQPAQADGMTGTSVVPTTNLTDEGWIKAFHKALYAPGARAGMPGGYAGTRVAEKIIGRLIKHSSISDQELQTILNNPSILKAMVRNYGSVVFTDDTDIAKYSRYFINFLHQGMSPMDAAVKAGKFGGIKPL